MGACYRATLNPCYTDDERCGMANLTVTIDDEVLRSARLRALEQGTSVNALLRAYLESYAGLRDRRAQAVTELLTLSGSSSSGRGDRRWTRAEIHER